MSQTDVEISEKNKKGEILDAYRRLLKEMKQRDARPPQEKKKREEEKKQVAQVSDLSVDRILKEVSAVKLSVTKDLDDLERRLLTEYRKFVAVQEAISSSENTLEELYQISAEAESLQALIEAQKQLKEESKASLQETRERFDADMAEKRLAWEKEQADHEAEKKERNQQLKANRQREEEEYHYKLTWQRQKDADAYEQKRQTQERELKEEREQVEQALSRREANVAQHEEELAYLRAQVEGFPQQLEKAVEDAQSTTRKQVEQEFRFQIELSSKEVEGQCQLHQQIVRSLEEKIKEQALEICSLKEQSSLAGGHVREIAVKAIESSRQGQRSTPYGELTPSATQA